MAGPPNIQRLRGLILSAADLRTLTDWPAALVEDYLDVVESIDDDINNLIATIQYVESIKVQTDKNRVLINKDLKEIQNSEQKIEDVRVKADKNKSLLNIEARELKDLRQQLESINSRVNKNKASLLLYFLLAGRPGGQIGYFDTDSGGGGELHSTSHATKGTINLGDTAYVDEVNNMLETIGIGWFHAATGGAEQTNIQLGELSTSSTTPMFEFVTNDVGADILEIRSNRQQNQFLYSQDDGVGGYKKVWSTLGNLAAGSIINIYDVSEDIGIHLNAGGESYIANDATALSIGKVVTTAAARNLLNLIDSASVGGKGISLIRSNNRVVGRLQNVVGSVSDAELMLGYDTNDDGIPDQRVIHLTTKAATNSYINNTGNFGLGTPTPGAKVHSIAGSAATIGTIIQGFAAQEEPLLQLRKSDATVYTSFDEIGQVSGVVEQQIFFMGGF